ncbi:MAG: glycosyltransferase, partial [Clostridia bacterium]|nr:glycosyltransferase [Clostridia bacterium]
VEGVYRSAKDVRLVVLDSRNASVAGALNAGVNLSSYPIVAQVFPDLRLTKDALLKTVYAFVSDPACVYIGSFARVGDNPDEPEQKKTAILAQEQYLERLASFYINRAGYADLGVYLPLSRTFAAFLKSAVMESGGFSETAKAESADLLLRMHKKMRNEKRAYCARMLPDAVCYQQPKKSMRDVIASIQQGQREMRDTVRRNRATMREISGAGETRVAEKSWPFVELLGILTVLCAGLIGAVPPLFVVLYLLLGVLLGAVQTVLSALLEEYAFQRQTDTGLLLRRYLLAIADQIGFHLYTTLVRIFS